MARASDDLQEKAKSLYQEGKILKDIAEELGLSQGTVRSWKSRHKWDTDNPNKQRNATQDKKRNVASKKGNVSPAVKSVMKNDSLSDQQKEFCLYFVKSFNATQSYIKAYGSNYKTALSAGPRLLGNVRVGLEINRLKEERYTRNFLKAEDIFQRYMDIAFSDISDYLWFGREMVPVMGPFGPIMETLPDGTKAPLMKEINSVRFREASEVDTSILAEVKQGKDGSSIKLMDRMKALDWLADHIGMATERQKLELQLLKVEIDSKAGNEEELSKLDQMLASVDKAASERGGE